MPPWNCHLTAPRWNEIITIAHWAQIIATQGHLCFLSLHRRWTPIHLSTSYRRLFLCPLSANLLRSHAQFSFSVFHIIISNSFFISITPPPTDSSSFSQAAAGSWGLFSKSREQPTHTPKLLTPAESISCQLTILFPQSICSLRLYMRHAATLFRGLLALCSVAWKEQIYFPGQIVSSFVSYGLCFVLQTHVTSSITFPINWG